MKKWKIILFFVFLRKKRENVKVAFQIFLLSILYHIITNVLIYFNNIFEYWTKCFIKKIIINISPIFSTILDFITLYFGLAFFVKDTCSAVLELLKNKVPYVVPYVSLSSKTKLDSLDCHWMNKIFFFKISSFVFYKKKRVQDWYDMRVSKWLCLNYPFKRLYKLSTFVTICMLVLLP